MLFERAGCSLCWGQPSARFPSNFNDSDTMKLYKMRTDGTERNKINDDESENINIADGWIYYKDCCGDGGVNNRRDTYDF